MSRENHARNRKLTPGPTVTVAYARVSSREQQEGFSIGAQLDLIRNYSVTLDLPIEKEFTDAETAKTTGRPNFNAMLAFIRGSSSPVTILVEKTDRMYRNFKDFTTIDDLVREKDTRIHLVKEGSVLGRETGSHTNFVHGIKVLMAKNYIDNLSEEVVKGMRKKAATGQYPSYPPVGYLWVRNERKIIPHPDTADQVRRAFELYATGDYSLARTAEILNDEGFLTRQKKPLSKHGLEYILKNTMYYGDFYWAGEYNVGQFEALVSRETWDACQEQLRRKNHPEQYRKTSLPYLGLFTCAKCGCAITGEIKKGKFVYYRCSNGKKICERVYVRQEEIEAQIFRLIEDMEIPEAAANFLSASLDVATAEEETNRRSTEENLRKTSESLKTQLDRLYTDHAAGKIDEAFFTSKWNEWKRQLSRVDAERCNLVSPVSHSGRLHAKNAIELAKSAKSLFETRDRRFRAKLTKTLLSNPSLDGRTVRKDYNFPFGIWVKNGGSLDWREIRDEVQTRLSSKAAA